MNSIDNSNNNNNNAVEEENKQREKEYHELFYSLYNDLHSFAKNVSSIDSIMNMISQFTSLSSHDYLHNMQTQESLWQVCLSVIINIYILYKKGNMTSVFLVYLIIIGQSGSIYEEYTIEVLSAVQRYIGSLLRCHLSNQIWSSNDLLFRHKQIIIVR